MKNKIRTRLTLSFGAVIILFTLIIGSVFVMLFRNHAIEINKTAMQEQAVAIAETLSTIDNTQKQGQGRSDKGGYGTYLNFLDKLNTSEVWIVDENLNFLIQGSKNHNITYGEMPENAEEIVKRVFDGEVTYGKEFSSVLEAPTITVGAPILKDGKVIGAVLLHSLVSGIDESISSSIFVLFISASIALIVSSIVAYALSYYFSSPLEKMRKSALELSNGNYDVKTQVNQKDEIGELALVLDELAGRLKLAKEEQEKFDKLKDDFIANVSHELRTPISILKGSLENLIDDTVSTPEEIKEYYGAMLSESNHLQRLVNDLLDLSKLQDDCFKLQFESFNLNDVVNDSIRSIRVKSKEKNINIDFNYADELIINADYGRIRQLLIILLDNAIKFSFDKTTISINVSKDKKLTITNHGEEIPKEMLPHIFDRFYKSTTKQNNSGTGLGLSIAKEIVNRHNYEISATSKDETTTFEITFN